MLSSNFEVIDFHVHPLKLLSEKLLMEELDFCNVKKCVLLAIDVDHKILDKKEVKNKIIKMLFDKGHWDLWAFEHMKCTLQLAKITNEEVASLMNSYPSRLIGIGSINAFFGEEYVKEKIEEIKRLGLKGVKIIPTLQFFDPVEKMEELRLIFDFCEKNRKLILIHTGCDPGPWEDPRLSNNAKPNKFRQIVSEFPDAYVVFAHAGSYSIKFPGIWLEEALEICRKHDNVWVDIAAVSYLVLERKFVRKIKETIGIERVLFGSDYPVIAGKAIKDSINDVVSSKEINGEEAEQILHLNALEILKHIK